MRRKIAARMLLQGKGVREVAEAVGVSSTSVYRWKKALKAKPHPGRSPRLSQEQKKELEVILLWGQGLLGFQQTFGLCQGWPRSLKSILG